MEKKHKTKLQYLLTIIFLFPFQQNPTNIVRTGTKRTASSLPASIPLVDMKAPTSAAGAASTPKMNWSDVERSPKMSIGNTEP